MSRQYTNEENQKTKNTNTNTNKKDTGDKKKDDKKYEKGKKKEDERWTSSSGMLPILSPGPNSWMISQSASAPTGGAPTCGAAKPQG